MLAHIRCPPPHLQVVKITPECPVLDPVLEKFSLAGLRCAAPPTPSRDIPHNISTPNNKNTPLRRGVYIIK